MFVLNATFSPEAIGSSIGGFLFLLIGLALVVWSGRLIWLFRKSFHWPKAGGVVTDSEVVEKRDGDGGNQFELKVNYSFSVAGQVFLGDRLTFGIGREEYPSKDEAERRAAAFPVGALVPVTHHPDRPTECVLQRRLGSGVYFVFLLGVVFSVAAVSVIIELIS